MPSLNRAHILNTPKVPRGGKGALTKEELRATLASLGLPRRHFGALLGVTENSVRRWLRGTRPVPQFAEAYLALLMYVWGQFKNDRRLQDGRRYHRKDAVNGRYIGRDHG